KRIEKKLKIVENLDIPEEILNHLIHFYPHFGLIFTKKCYPEISDYPLEQIRQKLKLKMLPKQERICISCKENLQSSRGGYNCKDCDNLLRYKNRRTENITVEKRLGELLRTVRYRSNVESDLTLDFLINLYNKQSGKCFYSGIQMTCLEYGMGRHQPFTISIDQIKPKIGYTKDNVVLCCWIINCAKNELSVEEYIETCELVSNRKNEILQGLKIIKSNG
ncbi:MAG: hypothetical protein AABY22_23240, partial [Nanoarchaeota archaeon]